MKRDMVAGLIIENNKLLMVHNTKYNGLRVEPPGGKKEDNESWEHAVIREIQEELGITVTPKSIFGEYDTHSPEGDFLVRMYWCDIIEGEPKILEPDKVSRFEWYSYDQLDKLKTDGHLVPNMCEALPKLQRYF